jgi:cytoskeletal protein RodZ
MHEDPTRTMGQPDGGHPHGNMRLLIAGLIAVIIGLIVAIVVIAGDSGNGSSTSTPSAITTLPTNGSSTSTGTTETTAPTTTSTTETTAPTTTSTTGTEEGGSGGLEAP